MEIIGAGFGRTGTLSLKAALEELGYDPCYHMVELMDNPQHAKLWRAAYRGTLSDWEELLGGYRATVDWPGCSFWRELLDAYPDAKVVLSVRDPKRWFDSASSTIFQGPGTQGPLSRAAMFAASALRPDRLRTMLLVRDLIPKYTFGGNVTDPDHAIDVFNRHNAEVERGVPPERLLVYEVKQGWEPLCEFLGVEVPDKPFPHVNDSGSFHTTIGARMRRQLAADAAPAAAALAGVTLLGAGLVAARRWKGSRRA